MGLEQPGGWISDRIYNSMWTNPLIIVFFLSFPLQLISLIAHTCCLLKWEGVWCHAEKPDMHRKTALNEPWPHVNFLLSPKHKYGNTNKISPTGFCYESRCQDWLRMGETSVFIFNPGALNKLTGGIVSQSSIRRGRSAPWPGTSWNC